MHVTEIHPSKMRLSITQCLLVMSTWLKHVGEFCLYVFFVLSTDQTVIAEMPELMTALQEFSEEVQVINFSYKEPHTLANKQIKASMFISDFVCIPVFRRIRNSSSNRGSDELFHFCSSSHRRKFHWRWGQKDLTVGPPEGSNRGRWWDLIEYKWNWNKVNHLKRNSHFGGPTRPV